MRRNSKTPALVTRLEAELRASRAHWRQVLDTRDGYQEHLDAPVSETEFSPSWQTFGSQFLDDSDAGLAPDGD
jgi:hypothetical protein